MDKEEIFELFDEDGNLETYKLYDSFEFESQNYVILIDSNEEAVLFKFEEKDGEYNFIQPDNEEFSKVSQAYYESD